MASRKLLASKTHPATATRRRTLRERLLLYPGTGPTDVKFFSTAFLEETHLDGALALLQGNGTGTGLVAMNSIVVHYNFAVDKQ